MITITPGHWRPLGTDGFMIVLISAIILSLAFTGLLFYVASTIDCPKKEICPKANCPYFWH